MYKHNQKENIINLYRMDLNNIIIIYCLYYEYYNENFFTFYVKLIFFLQY